jgi:hypothetical protein
VSALTQNRSAINERSFCDLRPRKPVSCCIRVPSEIIHDPDPSIYDQRLVFDSGSLPSFNSPDINTVDIWPIRPIENLSATVRNLSADASANQTRVDLTWSVWGIGMQREPIGSSFVDLARAGFTGSEKTLSWPLPPALNAAERYGIFVKILHPYDRNPANNEGEQTVDGFQTSQGRSKSFVVPVRNPSGSIQNFSLTAGPAPVAPWVTIVPAAFTLGAGAQQNVMVSVHVPPGIPPSPPGTLISGTVDVMALMSGSYLGGVSILILFDA